MIGGSPDENNGNKDNKDHVTSDGARLGHVGGRTDKRDGQRTGTREYDSSSWNYGNPAVRSPANQFPADHASAEHAPDSTRPDSARNYSAGNHAASRYDSDPKYNSGNGGTRLNAERDDAQYDRAGPD